LCHTDAEIIVGRKGTDVAGHDLAHPGEQHGGAHDEPVVAPDQLKEPPFRRLTYTMAFLVIVFLPIMALVGNHRGNVEKVFLIGIAALMLLGIIIEWSLRKLGLKN
jgi:hypothetical protein